MLLNSSAQFLIVIFFSAVLAEMDSQEAREKAEKSFKSLLKNIIDINEKRIAAIKRIAHLDDFIKTKNSLAKLHEKDIMAEADSLDDDKNQDAVFTYIDMRSNINLKLRRKYNEKQAANNNINIIIPFNSFNIQSDYRNGENNKINKNEYDGKTHKVDDLVYKNMYTSKLKDFIYNIAKIKPFLDDKMEITNHDRIQTGKNNEMDLDDFIMAKICKDNVSNYNNDDNRGMEDEINQNYRKNWRGSCDRKAAKVCRKACVSAHRNGCMQYKCSRRAKKAFSKECKRSCKAKFETGKYSDSE